MLFSTQKMGTFFFVPKGWPPWGQTGDTTAGLCDDDDGSQEDKNARLLKRQREKMSQPTPGSNLRTRKPSDISSFCAFDAGFLGEAGGANARKKIAFEMRVRQSNVGSREMWKWEGRRNVNV